MEITGPTERKMFIDALNSSSDMFMADVEDSLSSTWNSIVEGQMNLIDANKKTITFMNSDGNSFHTWIFFSFSLRFGKRLCHVIFIHFIPSVPDR